MIQIDLPMPKECAFAYEVIERPASEGVSEIKTSYPCPCYDGDLMECQAVVPNRTLYAPFKGVDELHENYRPKWCPLKEQDAVKPTWQEGKAFCGSCGLRIPMHRQKKKPYCPSCGRRVKWE